ncbi:MAG: ABC transporter permease [Flavobacteriaceae bacterium]
MNHLKLITEREFLNKVKNKTFIIMTFVSPLIMVGIFALVAYLTQLNNDKVRTISVLDESNLFANEFENTEHTKYHILTNVTLDDAKKIVQESNNYGLLYIPKGHTVDELSDKIIFFSEESPSLIVMDKIENRIEEKARNIKLKESGLDPEVINKLKVNVSANLETFSGEKTSKIGGGLKLIFGGAAGYLLFMFIIIYGNMIMRSVIEEKTSRIIEVIISSVKPIQLLLGKIFGTSLAGISQFLVWVVIGGILLTVLSTFFGIDVAGSQMANGQIPANQLPNNEVALVVQEMWNLPIANLIIMFILFFIGGYLLYSSLYAAIGAAVDNETDTQQFMMPIVMPLVLAIYVGFFTVIENPHGTVSQVFSFIPFTSPVVMLMRIPFGVPLWQQVLSVAILFGTFYLFVIFAAKIYRVGILMYGKKPTYKELYKWLKY